MLKHFPEAEILFDGVIRAVAAGSSVAATGVWGSGAELLVAHLRQKFPSRPIFVLLPTVDATEKTLDDLPFFLGCEPVHLIGFDAPPLYGDFTALETLGSRVRVATHLLERKPTVVVSALQSSLQPMPSRAALEAAYLRIQRGDFLPPEELVKKLINFGFKRERMVERIGEFAVRGGIIDIFPILADEPIRIEFFGDDIESLRRFDPISQRTSTELDECFVRGMESRKVRSDWLNPASETIYNYLPPNTLIVASDFGAAIESAIIYWNHHSKEAPGILSPDRLTETISKFQRVEVEKSVVQNSELQSVDCALRSLMRFEVNVEQALVNLIHLAGQRERVVVCCHNEAERERLKQLLEKQELPTPNAEMIIGRISGGFDAPSVGLTLLTDAEIFNRYRQSRKRGARYKGTPFTDIVDIKPGELVVHIAHGISVYEGIFTIEKDGRKAEYLRLRFGGDVKVYVPLHQIDLVQKYIGAKGEPPPLSVIGGTTWAKRKEAVEESLRDLAQELLNNQAQRSLSGGITHPHDTDWQRRFEAAFIYEETDDQLKVVDEIKRDMERPIAMDRLLCGDVGFGKTEIVIRAAFKTVMGGRQVAVLVPTTLLAEQHFRTFKERMADYPVEIDVLSRFRSRGEQAAIVQKLREGAVDIIIGTHRLLSEDIEFKSLGLVVIDEEHKFGVEHKERLKQIVTNVDMLTLTATPIPRTLHMSLVGIRDVSNLYTAPAERLPIITKVSRFDRDLIRRAIIRELDRNGQVYFLHNRVESIYRTAAMIERYVPEARVGVAHGQMDEDDLESVMIAFLDREIDVLVCTTIIESGIDIPNANTMIIMDADYFGLATLHQLRGRIGRYKHQGYCYLLVPANRALSPVGQERLKAIEEFSELGAGFQLAMRDLEIRGAGNILGREQHGHINAIGYDLFCSLLEKTVRRLKGEVVEEDPIEVVLDLDIDAYFPENFSIDERGKIKLYRRLVRMQTESDIDELKTELEDIYGPLPRGVANLLELHRLKVRARQAGIYRISIEEFGIGMRFVKFNLKRAEELFGNSSGVVGGMLEDGVIIKLPKTADSPEKRLETLKKLLNPKPAKVSY